MFGSHVYETVGLTGEHVAFKFGNLAVTDAPLGFDLAFLSGDVRGQFHVFVNIQMNGQGVAFQFGNISDNIHFEIPGRIIHGELTGNRGLTFRLGGQRTLIVHADFIAGAGF